MQPDVQPVAQPAAPSIRHRTADPPMTVKSPCIGHCLLDVARQCVGCGRSGQEIAAWSRLSDAAKRQLVVVARQRLDDARAANRTVASEGEGS